MGRGTSAFFGGKFHAVLGIAKAQAGEGVDDHAPARHAAQGLAPGVGHVAVELVQKVSRIGSAQLRFNFACQCHRLLRGPARQHAGMHHQQRLAIDHFEHGQALPAQPIQQRVPVAGCKHIGDGVAAVWPAHPLGQGQQVQVVVAQQAFSGAAIAHQAAQHPGRIWPPVHQIAQHEKRVATGGKINLVEQALQGGVATLHIANQVKCHAVHSRR